MSGQARAASALSGSGASRPALPERHPRRAARAALPWAFESGVVRLSIDPLIGAVFAGLRVESILAEGGIGVVYAASDVETGKPLALKVLQRRHADDPGMVSRFAREIGFALRVAHPNVAAVLRHGRLEDARPFFVMDRFEGETLGAMVRRSGPLPIERALDVGDQVLAGLAALHAARVVHRDLQPDNVLIARDGRVLLLDLGFAEEPGPDRGDGVTPDSPGSLVGTLSFMAPEQATRSRAVTERSDLFATALLLFYALTGKLPFRGDDALARVVAMVRAAPIRLRRERRDAPVALEAALARALAKHPDARFESASAMREALRAVR
jgi:serine/threonine protein kinase